MKNTTMSLALAATLLSCYQPNYAASHYKCEQPGTVCPDGEVCAGGTCVPQGADVKVDAAQADPCSAGWIEISRQSIYACKRTFKVTSGDFSHLCRDGYHVCDGSEDLSAVEGGDACNKAGGFFATQVDIALDHTDGDMTADGICSPRSTDMPRALLGCGSGPALYRLNSDRTCNRLRTSTRCDGPPQGWTCSSSKNVSLAALPGGVLCCVGK